MQTTYNAQNAQNLEKNLGGAALTAPPTSYNDTEQGNVATRYDDTVAAADVTPEAQIETSAVEVVTQAGDRAAAPAHSSASTDNGDNVVAITAEEIMAKHMEQAPSDDGGFSLDEVVATEQVVPVNMARAAGVNFRKPTDKEFIRVTQNQNEIIPFDILEVDDKTQYIVTPAAMSAINKLHEEAGKKMIKTRRVMMHLTVNLDGVGFLWPITVSDSENTWLDSAINCAAIAKGQWIRVVSNGVAKRYANKHAGVVPQWPKETFIEMLNLAFKNKVIRSLDHPAIKQLLDEE